MMAHLAIAHRSVTRTIGWKVASCLLVASIALGSVVSCSVIQWIPDTPDQPRLPPEPEGPHLSRSDAGDDAPPSEESTPSGPLRE